MDRTYGISVIVFCFNSEKFIRRNLQHILSQKISNDIPCEIIVIDNNSTDQTFESAQSILRSQDIFRDYRVVEEKRQGLSFAREKAILLAKHEILIFVDDDNFLESDYLSNAYDFMINNPQAGICGSQSIAEYEKEPGDWFKSYQQAIAIGEQGNKIEDVTKTRKYVWGAGMVVRKSLAQKAFSNGFQFINTGRAGKHLGSSEDVELCYAFIALRSQIYYNDKLKLLHHIPAFRTEKRYIKKIIIGYGASTIWLDIFEWFQAGRFLNTSVSKIFLIHHLILLKNFSKRIRGAFFSKFRSNQLDINSKDLVIKGRVELFYKIKAEDYFKKVSSIKKFYSKCKQDDLS